MTADQHDTKWDESKNRVMYELEIFSTLSLDKGCFKPILDVFKAVSEGDSGLIETALAGLLKCYLQYTANLCRSKKNSGEVCNQETVRKMEEKIQTMSEKFSVRMSMYIVELLCKKLTGKTLEAYKKVPKYLTKAVNRFFKSNVVANKSQIKDQQTSTMHCLYNFITSEEITLIADLIKTNVMIDNSQTKNWQPSTLEVFYNHFNPEEIIQIINLIIQWCINNPFGSIWIFYPMAFVSCILVWLAKFRRTAFALALAVSVLFFCEAGFGLIYQLFFNEEKLVKMSLRVVFVVFLIVAVKSRDYFEREIARSQKMNHLYIASGEMLKYIAYKIVACTIGMMGERWRNLIIRLGINNNNLPI